MTENSKVEAPAASEIEELDKEGAHASSQERPYRKNRRGYVDPDTMDKTVGGEGEERVRHARYGKVTRKPSRFKAHDEENTAGTGDRVLIMETRPLAATKNWRLVEIIERAKGSGGPCDRARDARRAGLPHREGRPFRYPGRSAWALRLQSADGRGAGARHRSGADGRARRGSDVTRERRNRG